MRESSGYQSGFPQQSPYQMASPYQAAPPAARSTNWAKIIMITLAILVVVGVVGVVGAVLFIRSAVNQVASVSEGESGGKEAAINLPGGQQVRIANSAASEEQLGVPIYPGAVPDQNGSVSISGTSATGSGWIGAATFTTEDEIEEVVAFYREKLGDDVQAVDSTQDGKRTVIFNTPTEKGWRSVAIQDEGAGEVKIVITSIQGSRAP